MRTGSPPTALISPSNGFEVTGVEVPDRSSKATLAIAGWNNSVLRIKRKPRKVFNECQCLIPIYNYFVPTS